MQLKVEKILFPTNDKDFLYPGPEEQFHFYKGDSKIGWVEGAPKILQTGQKKYVLQVIEVLKQYRGNGYSLEMLKYLNTQYKCPIVPFNVQNMQYWDHVLSKNSVEFQVHAPLSNHEFEMEMLHWKTQVK